MSPPVWVLDMAERFWAAAGSPPPVPRDLEGPATAALPVRVVRLADLTLDTVRTWLGRAGVYCPTGEPDRALRACLVARAGFGFVFLDAADPPDEQRFSLAHEVAHFQRDYNANRLAAVRAAGPGVLAVLDGMRPVTVEERVAALLRAVPLVAHVHLLSRDDAGRPLSAAERESEDAADRLAFELLAPAAMLPRADAATLRSLLADRFGLPTSAAVAYAAVLGPTEPPADPILRRLSKS